MIREPLDEPWFRLGKDLLQRAQRGRYDRGQRRWYVRHHDGLPSGASAHRVVELSLERQHVAGDRLDGTASVGDLHVSAIACEQRRA